MKRIILLFALFSLAMINNAQENSLMPLSTTLIHNNNAKFLLFPTRNIYIFLKLNTSTGEVSMVQYSLKEEERCEISIQSSLYPLVKRKEQQNGRFYLYPTNNIYNFILLDQVDGRAWQVQWNVDKDKRFVDRIYNDNPYYNLSDSIRIKDLESINNVLFLKGKLFKGLVLSNDGKSIALSISDGRRLFKSYSFMALHDNGKCAFVFGSLKDIGSADLYYYDEDDNKIDCDTFTKKYSYIITRVKQSYKDFIFLENNE